MKDSTYIFEVYGAMGGSGHRTNAGNGAKVTASFDLKKGAHLAILVGQQGEYFGCSSCGGGGGGGTFIWVPKDHNDIWAEVRACGYACVRVGVRMCFRACELPCVRACVRA